MNFPLIPILKKNLNYIAILSAITIFSYIFSLNNKFVWDDEQFIYNNSYIKNFAVTKIFTENTIAGAGENSTYYRPLTTFSFAVDHEIWGLNPLGFHLNNTLLHLGAGILLFFYLRTLKFSKLTSLTIASIFLTHPLQTEAVVYANSRGDSMYAFFAMSSLLSFALLLTKKYPKIEIYDLKIVFNKKVLFFITLLSYLLAILGKEIGIATLGLIGLTFLFIKLHKNKNLSTKIIFKNILGIITVAFSTLIAIGYLIFRNKILNIATTQNNYFADSLYGESIYVRLHTFTQAIWTYFSLIFFPYPLHMERNLKILEQPISIWLLATVVLIVILVFTSIKEYKKHKSFYVAFGSLWFIGMLVPVSGIIPINGLIYEHWLYLPIIGFLIVLYGLKITFIPKKYQANIYLIIKAMLPFIILILITLTIRQNYIWGTPIRFYNHTLKFSKTARLHNNLAMAYADNKEFNKAIIEYNKAIDINDYYPQTHHNLANTYLSIGEIEDAKKEFYTAIRINSNFMPAYFPLIKILSQEKDYKNITPLIDKLLKMSPNNIEYKYIKAINQINQGNIINGLKSLNEILKTPGITTQLKLIISNSIKQYR